MNASITHFDLNILCNTNVVTFIIIFFSMEIFFNSWKALVLFVYCIFLFTKTNALAKKCDNKNSHISFKQNID
jgi:hypothetical protein